MTNTVLERRYRRWLKCYPPSFRREHEEEILAVLIASAPRGQERPVRQECIHLLAGAVAVWLRPRVPRSDWATFYAVRLMYLGAAAELAVALTILATIDDIHANILRRHPDYTSAEWHAELSGQLKPLIATAFLGVLFWLVIAWANGRSHRWARIAFALFVTLNISSLLNGLEHGSATYAPTDLAAATLLCLLELTTLALLLRQDLRKIPINRLRSRPRS